MIHILGAEAQARLADVAHRLVWNVLMLAPNFSGQEQSRSCKELKDNKRLS